jgi:hypothetical protein
MTFWRVVSPDRAMTTAADSAEFRAIGGEVLGGFRFHNGVISNDRAKV